MQGDDLQNLDIDQARLIISLKVDEINNLKASLKTLEIKNNLKSTDLQHKIDYFQNKVIAGEAKLTKTQEANKKQKTHFEEQKKQLDNDINKQKEINENLIVQSHQKERELNGLQFEQKLKLQKQRQINARLNDQLEVVSKYFQPKKVLAALKKQKLEEIPSYLDLYGKYINAQQSLQYANLQMSTMKSRVMSEMEESFLKMSSYESIMEDLKYKNEELKLQISQKQVEIEKHSQEINNKKQVIQMMSEGTNFHLEHLNQEILQLRSSVANYEKEQEKEDKRHNFDAIYLQQIEQLEKRLAMKQTEFDNLSAYVQDKVNLLEQQNKMLKVQIQQRQASLKQNLQQQQIRVSNFQKELQAERQVIALMNTNLKEQQYMIDQLKKEVQKRTGEINELIRKKKKIEQESKQNQQAYMAQIQLLHDEIKSLKRQITNLHPEEHYNSNRKYSYAQKSIDNRSQQNNKMLTRVYSATESFKSFEGSKILLQDLNQKMNLAGEQDIQSNIDIGHYYQEDPSWPQKYYSLLQKHNQFIKKVYGKLQRLKVQK